MNRRDELRPFRGFDRGQMYFGRSTRPSRNATHFYRIAKRLGLSHPFGRAAYLANRLINGDYRQAVSRTTSWGNGPTAAEDEAALRSVRAETAARWERHWRRGGSIKALRYSQDAWLNKKSAEDARVKEIQRRNREITRKELEQR